jgi:hypothetical protein
MAGPPAAPVSSDSQPETAHPRDRRRLAFRVTLACFGVAVAFLIGEIVVRLAGLAPANFYTYDAHLGWAMEPGANGWQEQEGRAYLQVNRDGFRGPDYLRQKSVDTLRIAVLGDSVTEAQQVPYEDTFCVIIQRQLRAQCPLKAQVGGQAQRTFKHVEVMNFGCDGYGTAQELITLRRRVWSYSPDVVVLALFTGNDIRNNSVVLEGDKCRPFFVYRNGNLVLGGPFEDSLLFHAHCMLRFESRHSQLLNILGSARSVLSQRIRAPLHAKTATNARPARRPGSELGLNDLVYRPPSTPVWREAWRVTDGEVEMMNREVKEHGARFLVVTMSNGIQVDPNTRLRASYMKYIGVENLFYPDDHIRELGEHDGFAVLNLARPLQSYADEHHVYLHGFTNTHFGAGHWNTEGHRVAGELIASKVLTLVSAASAPPSPLTRQRSPVLTVAICRRRRRRCRTTPDGCRIPIAAQLATARRKKPWVSALPAEAYIDFRGRSYVGQDCLIQCRTRGRTSTVCTRADSVRVLIDHDGLQRLRDGKPTRCSDAYRPGSEGRPDAVGGRLQATSRLDAAADRAAEIAPAPQAGLLCRRQRRRQLLASRPRQLPMPVSWR